MKNTHIKVLYIDMRGDFNIFLIVYVKFNIFRYERYGFIINIMQLKIFVTEFDPIIFIKY